MYIRDSSIPAVSTFALSANSLLLEEYEVFLSFCGKDTRNGFTDFLYTYLQGAGIRTFRDDNVLCIGEEIGPELLKAITSSKISIPIFSRNYASSKWCLLELKQMVECQANAKGEKMIYPIFYDVDPYDVSHQSGSYEEAFRQYEKKKQLDERTVRSWKEALTKVGQLKGLELKKETGGREGELVKIIVDNVLRFLKKHYAYVPKNLVGMGNHIENLMGLLNIDSNDVRIVGIHGMGGLGKTTIAKVIYNQLCQHYESHCFLDNVRENSKHCDGVIDLQNQLISKIQKGGVSKVSDVYEGSDIINVVVRERKVLIVLDDVDEKFQVDMLIGHNIQFGEGSRIIITTRNKSVLEATKVPYQREELLYVYTSYQPDLLDNLHSLKLFCKYAFRNNYPIEGYDILSKEVVSIAAGLPLVLVVLGSTFHTVKGKDLWEEKLRKLRVVPHMEVLEKLRFSFEVLDYEQKEIFLDIACLFIGCDKSEPYYMWDDCGFYPGEGINVLINRSLITVGDDNKLLMHDQLRDLGRQIVREEGLNELGKRSRLWCEEDAMHILETNQGTNYVSALCLSYFQRSEGPLLASHFRDVPNLRYLIMNGQELDGDFKHLLSNLRWLRWRCSGEFMPTSLHMKNLVILELSGSQFPDDWDGWSQFKMAKKLKLLDLTRCNGIRVLPHLSTHASLEILKLGNCWSVSRLDGLEQLKSLKYLNVSGCYQLETLPSLSNLTKLVELHLQYCTKLVELKGLEKLESLQVLDISECCLLERLPKFSNLTNLKTFNAFECRKLIEIEGLHKLNSLEHLDLRNCTFLTGVLDMSNLNKLKLLLAPQLEITNLSSFRELRHLWISFNDNPIKFQGQDGLALLEYLHIYGGSMKILPDLSSLKRLKILQVMNCSELIDIQGLGEMESLEGLYIFNCSSIETLSFLSNMRKLEEFYCNNCEKLVEINGLDKLESLKVLKIGSSPSLERLPNLPNFGMLEDIEVESCGKLHEVAKLGVIDSLKRLTISCCYKLREIPNLRRLKKLESLSIHFLEELTGITGLEELNLKRLDINGCKSIEVPPKFSHLERLRGLDSSSCAKTTKIRGVEDLKLLKNLVIDGCE